MTREFRKRRDPGQVAKALRALGLQWTRHNNNLHWKIEHLGLDIWPTRWKTMHERNVVEWQVIEDFKRYVSHLKPVPPGPTKSQKRSLKKRERRQRKKEGRTVGSKYNEADFQAFRDSGELPW